MKSIPIQEIPPRNLPHQSELYLKYLEHDPQALRFYGHPPTLENVEAAAREEMARSDYPRSEVARILMEQNERFGLTEKTRRNIEDFKARDSVAVVTGQQVGLFSGPLYTIYKALTAIRLAEELRGRGIRAVPVFWMASEDHDLAEVTKVTVTGSGTELQSADFGEALFGQAGNSARPVGAIRLPEKIHEALEWYLAPLAGMGRTDYAGALLASAYRPGSTFTESFGRLMGALFSSSGLILFDPLDEKAKRISAPVIERYLQESGNIRSALSGRDKEIEAAGFEPQVRILEHSTLLFLYEGGERLALTAEEKGFGLRKGEGRFALQQLLELARTDPGRFSPNVLLRPIVQDHLFPTAAYVAGPGETAYFAQAEVLYGTYGRPMPVIWPRQSMTLLSGEICEALDHHGIGLEDCFMGRDHLLQKMLQAPAMENRRRLLEGLRTFLERGLAETRPAVTAADATLGPALDNAGRKILHHVDSLQTKLLHMEARRAAAPAQEAARLMNCCYPGGSLQERRLALPQFLAQYGPSLIDALYSVPQGMEFAHQAVCLVDGFQIRDYQTA